MRQENTASISMLRYYQYILENYFVKGFLVYFSGPSASGQCPIRDSKEHLFAVSFGEYEKSVINHMIFGWFEKIYLSSYYNCMCILQEL